GGRLGGEGDRLAGARDVEGLGARRRVGVVVVAGLVGGDDAGAGVAERDGGAVDRAGVVGGGGVDGEGDRVAGVAAGGADGVGVAEGGGGGRLGGEGDRLAGARDVEGLGAGRRVGVVVVAGLVGGDDAGAGVEERDGGAVDRAG